METVILEMLETAAIAVSGFLIKKYVFLEPDMEAKKQKFFYLLSFFPDRHCVLGFWKRYGKHDSAAYDRAEYLPWQEKASPVRTGSDAAVSGNYQRAVCSDNACTVVFLCAVGTGNRSLSVYPLWGIIHAASFILYEREKLAQLVSG